MKDRERLISDLMRKALNGDVGSFKFAMGILETIKHPILEQIDRRVSGVGALEAIILPVSTLVLGYPKPLVHRNSLVWVNESGRPHNVLWPAELWFRDRYISFSQNGVHHREGGPAVVDIDGRSISYEVRGHPLGYTKGPFKILNDSAMVVLVYNINGEHVLVTDEFIELEDGDRAPASKDDVTNVHKWAVEQRKWLEWGDNYLSEYLTKFR
jgi:hypothetical protein